jgi:SNF2 family DNA or RNA helicase
MVLRPVDDKLDILVMNIEALSSKRGEDYATKFAQCHHTMIIIDESTSIKSVKSRRTKAALRLSKYAEYRRIATGTPITQGPLDLFSQCEFLKPGLLGHRTFSSFRGHYAVLKQMVIGHRQFLQVVGYRNLEQLQSCLKQFTSRLTKEQCLTLPEKVYETLPVPLTPAQSSAYSDVRNKAVLQHEKGLLTCESALVVIEKLHQICLGHLKLDDGTVIELEHNRIQILLRHLEIIGERKVVIWCRYQRDVENVMRALGDAYKKSGKFAVDYYGKTSVEARTHNLDQFIKNPDCLFLVGSGAVGGKGLTLVVSSYVFYYSYGYKLEERAQSEDRNHRIGQTQKVTYLDMYAPNTVEVEILTALREKKDLAKAILDKNYLSNLLNQEQEDSIPFD